MKIEEMAWKYVEKRRDLDIGRANCQFDCFDMEDAVKYGANAVLNEILRYIGNHSSFESDILKDKLCK